MACVWIQSWKALTSYPSTALGEAAVPALPCLPAVLWKATVCGFQQELASLWRWLTHQPSASGLEEPAGKHCPAQRGTSSVPCLGVMPPVIVEQDACSKCHSLAKKWDRVVFAVHHPSLSMGDRGCSPRECRRALRVECVVLRLLNQSSCIYLRQFKQWNSEHHSPGFLENIFLVTSSALAYHLWEYILFWLIIQQVHLLQSTRLLEEFRFLSQIPRETWRITLGLLSFNVFTLKFNTWMT